MLALLILLLAAGAGPASADAAAPAPNGGGTTTAPTETTPPAATTKPATPAETPVVANIPIGPYDILHLDVISQPDLSKDYIVDASGDINVPYVGKIRVVGLTPDQAEQVITKRLEQIYRTITLSLTRTAIGGITVTVTGQVARTGPVSIRRDARLNDVIQTLGATPTADLSKIQITRGLPGENHTTLTADLQSYLDSGNENGNPSLKEGDVVFVPMKQQAPKPVIYTVSVVGAVPRPGVFQVTPGSTVYDVVTMAGSLGSNADEKGLYLQPANASDPKIPLDWDKLAATPGDAALNPVVSDGDKIVVPEQTTFYTFSITGAVRSPNTYQIHGNISLDDAIAMAGGLLDGAKASDVTITRVTGTGKTVSTTKLDASSSQAALYAIQPSDHIYVPTGHRSPGLANEIGIGLGVLSIIALLHGL